jgi:hypothetical protein
MQNKTLPLPNTALSAGHNVLLQSMDGERSTMHEGSAAAAAAALQESYVAWQQRLDQIISQDPQVWELQSFSLYGVGSSIAVSPESASPPCE